MNYPITPKPVTGPSKHRPKGYPFAAMKVGDTFVAPGQRSQRIAGVVGYWRRKLGHEYATRNVDGGCEVQRVK